MSDNIPSNDQSILENSQLLLPPLKETPNVKLKIPEISEIEKKLKKS